MRAPILPVTLLAALAPAPAARAHPHVFIDTSLVFRFDDQGMLGAVSIVWAYDDFTSLITIEDMGLDPDGDGVLTEEELAQLRALGSNWDEGYEGDLYLTQNGRPLALSGPLEVEVQYHEGRIYYALLRALPQRADLSQGPVETQVYDPSYYTFYDLLAPPKVAGREDCRIAIGKADIAAAQRRYEAALAELTDEELLYEDKYPEIGGAFADTVRLECGGGS